MECNSCFGLIVTCLLNYLGQYRADTRYLVLFAVLIIVTTSSLASWASFKLIFISPSQMMMTRAELSWVLAESQYSSDCWQGNCSQMLPIPSIIQHHCLSWDLAQSVKIWYYGETRSTIITMNRKFLKNLIEC